MGLDYECARSDHSVKGSLSGNTDAGFIVGLDLTLEDKGFLPELASNFLNL